MEIDEELQKLIREHRASNPMGREEQDDNGALERQADELKAEAKKPWWWFVRTAWRKARGH